MARDENGSAKPRSNAEIADRINQARQLITVADLAYQKALHDLRIARIVLAECEDELLRGAN